ncbi:MAG TPA: hypothetical protein VHU19_13700 [Pyrinomonadaceae bacterium]|jgi:hypothetical protein|nr:hypothetical protein [Pyrinomonadaceae bacterium]
MVSTLETCARPALVSSYAVAGRSICVEAEEVWAAALFDRHFSGWHFRRSDATPFPSTSIKVFKIPPPALPHGLESFELPSGGRCHTEGLAYHLAYEDALVSVGGDSASAVKVWIGRREFSRREAALARLVFNAAMAAARRCGLYELHAAGVVEPTRGAGVLFLGPSGTGKSTLTTQLASAGWGYLSDDSLLLYENGESVEVHALRRAFSITDETISALSFRGFEDALTAPLPFDPSKRRFDPLEVFPEGYTESCVPSAIFFPSVTQEPSSRAERLSRRDAMALLIRMCPWAGYDRAAARGHLEALSRLAKSCSAYRLRAGTDLLGDAGRTADFLASLL